MLIQQTEGRCIDEILDKMELETDGTENWQGMYAFGPFHVFSSTMHGIASSPFPTLDSLLEFNPDVADEMFQSFSGIPWVFPDINIDLLGCEYGLQDNQPTETSLPPNNNATQNGHDQIQLMQELSTVLLQYPKTFAADISDLAGSCVKLLIKHYESSIASALTPVLGQKTPWQILHLPAVISTYGEIEIIGDSNNARVALLFAVLSVSAYQLHYAQSCSWQMWRFAEICRLRSKKRLMTFVREATGTRKAAKYKEILMAILSMVTISVCELYPSTAFSMASLPH